MGAISDFVATFRRDLDCYIAINEEVEKHCKEALWDIEFLWQSRVKRPESLEQKLRSRISNYQDEFENVADVKDLVAGRIILAHWTDFQHVKEVVKQVFTFKSQTQHPKQNYNAVSFKKRFRGYDGIHLYVKRPGDKDGQACDPIIEIQVMTAFMWGFMTLEHDIEYKKLHKKPDEGMLSSLDLLRGIANLGEIGLKMYDERLIPLAEHSSQRNGIDSDMQTMIRAVVGEVGLDEKDKQCLRDLRLTDPRHDRKRIEASKDPVLAGSCSWVMEDQAFVSWWDREDSRCLWIHGDPGKGKTMMMMSLISEVSRRLDDRPGANVLAYFFCQNTNERLNTTVSVLRGLIYLLVDQEKKLVRHIRKRYDIPEKRLFEDENAMYALQEILMDILTDLSLDTVYLMVDALDECDSTIHDLLKWIISTDSQIPHKIKWLTTSRNQPAFIERLGGGYQLHTSLELNSSHVAHAVARFIDHRVKELTALKSYSSELQVLVRESLLEKAEDTFLWVALVCKELTDIRRDNVESWLRKTPAGLVPLYERMLHQLLHQRDSEDIEVCRRILCAVILAFRPLCLDEIAIFAGVTGDVSELIGYCASFITIREDIVYLVHQSAKDFLCDGKRTEFLPSGKEHEHAITARLCLGIMSDTLKKDICDFGMPGICVGDFDETMIENHLPLYAQYACLYWVDHLQQAGPHEQEPLALSRDCSVYAFFQRHFLHWLEALSLMDKMSEAVLVINLLCSTPWLRKNTELSSFVKDASRFILEFRHIMETAPLQIYASALVFSPRDSIIRHLFSHLMPAWIETLPTVDKTWTASLQTLEGHSSGVEAIVFSHDGRLLASGSDDHSVRLWDPATGSSRRTLEGHLSRVNAVDFSSNGQLASASDDRSIRLWDPITGKTQGTLRGHNTGVIAIQFFPSGQLLASVSHDNTINTMKLWDLSKGTCQATFKILRDGNTAGIDISPDGQTLAFISHDGALQLYNPSVDALITTPKRDRIRPKFPRKVVISPNGQLLAAGSSESDVQLWDLPTRCYRGTVRGSYIIIRALIFSPNSQLLATLSSSNIVKLWNSVGELQYELQGTNFHSAGITEVIPSPDGRLLAAASLDYTITLWDSDKGIFRASLRGHSAQISQIAFSPDGRLLASASIDRTIRFWDPVVKTTRRTLEDCSGTEVSDGIVEWHSRAVTAIAFSRNGQLLASGSLDGTIKLWSSVGVLQHTFEGHTKGVCAMAFCPDGQHLASASDDHTIILRNISTKRDDTVFEADQYTEAMTFSADGRILACGGYIVITLWNSITRRRRGTLKGHLSRIHGMVFSPNSELLVSIHKDDMIRLWDVKNEFLLQQIDFQPGQRLSIKLDGSQSYDFPTVSDKLEFTPRKSHSFNLDKYRLQMDGKDFQMSLALDDTPQMQSVAGKSYAVGFENDWLTQKENEWVTYEGRRVLWLPKAYRPAIHAFHNNSLALGYISGRFMVLSLSTTNTPF